MIVGFEPIISKNPKILILGSMPSVTSLEKQEYYGYKHNRFWKILHQYTNMPIDTYEQKKNMIITNHMILWDVIHSCERAGSLDSNIKKEVVNPIDALLKKYPSLQYVICNGKKSAQLYLKHFEHLPLQLFTLPSTSNANRSICESQLFQIWIDTLKRIKEDDVYGDKKL